ncbi:MAG: hypothetical protein SFU27_04755 [Thermonemataceae bacterium]|nr:hypothetical protein [Thermonemataceae bacterium]
MKSFKTLYFTLFFFLVALLPTGGQSLVMSGNEIFEQEAIPSKKTKKEFEKKVQQKNLKQKGSVRVPVFSPKAAEKEQSNKIEKSKPAVSTYSYEQGEGKQSYALNIVLQVLLLLLSSLA